MISQLLLAQSDANEPVQVNTVNGPIVGETLVLERSQTVHRFLGIPYAEPPIGDLRFKKSIALGRNWSEPLQATQWPKRCSQDPNQAWNLAAKSMETNHEMSEDCLYLNVWTPGIETDETKLRPVVFWIHGGGYITGSANLALYDGNRLANMADAVVVTFNYRLSIFGFLYSDKVDGIKGNQCLWDQARALQWVHDNIRNFGGDPNKVTIFGESAGGWSVSAMILSPVTRNLFQNAFMMSGAVHNGVVAKPETMVSLFLKGIRKAGCATEADTSITEAVMKCINELEPSKIDGITYSLFDDHLGKFLI